jgi:hypothetical protein
LQNTLSIAKKGYFLLATYGVFSPILSEFILTKSFWKSIEVIGGSHLQESDQADDCFLTMKARLNLQQFNSKKRFKIVYQISNQNLTFIV